MAWSKRPFFPSLIKSLSHRERKRTLISKHVVARAAQPEPQTDAYLVMLKPGLCVNDLRA